MLRMNNYHNCKDTVANCEIKKGEGYEKKNLSGNSGICSQSFDD